MLAAKPWYKGESLQNSALSFKPIIFPGQKKRCCFGYFGFSFLWQIPCRAWHAPLISLDIGHGGSYLKVTSNKRADQDTTSRDVVKVPKMITHSDYFLQKLLVKNYMENFTCWWEVNLETPFPVPCSFDDCWMFSWHTLPRNLPALSLGLH